MQVKTGRNMASIVLDDGTILIVSYNTSVFEKRQDGMVRRLWDNYSLTTLNHVRTVFSWMTKAIWDKMAVGQWYKIENKTVNTVTEA